MNGFDMIGPRFVPVMRLGSDVLAGHRQVLDSGHGKVLSVPIFDPVIGRTSLLPFDDVVRDWKGNALGELTSPVQGKQSLRRW